MKVEEATAYLLEEPQPSMSYRVFGRLARSHPALSVTRQHPARLRPLPGWARVERVWLADAVGDGHQNPRALAGLARLIERFVNDHGGKGVVLLDGVEYLIVNNGFPAVFLFLEHLHEFLMQSRAILLIPVSPAALAPKDLALLERALTVADNDEWRDDLDAEEWSGRLDERV